MVAANQSFIDPPVDIETLENGGERVSRSSGANEGKLWLRRGWAEAVSRMVAQSLREGGKYTLAFKSIFHRNLVLGWNVLPVFAASRS